jgi:hypothetical protein
MGMGANGTIKKTIKEEWLWLIVQY